MDAHLQQLIDAVVASDADADYEALVRAVQDGALPLGDLLELTEAAHQRVRDAALAGSHQRSEPEFVARVRAMVNDPSQAVRYELGRGAVANPAWLDDEHVRTLLGDNMSGVRAQAISASAGRPSLASAVARLLAEETDWHMRQRAAETLRRSDTSVVVRPLFRQLVADSDSDVQHACASSLDVICESLGTGFGEVPQPAVKDLCASLDKLKELGSTRYPHLQPWLAELVPTLIDLEGLGDRGTVLSLPQELEKVPRAFGLDAQAEAIVEVLSGPAPRAAVVLGDSGVGKTALVHEVVHRLAAVGWHVVQRGSNDFIIGHTHIGQWESHLSELIELLRAPRKVVLYVPDLALLSQIGNWSKSDANVASMLAPFIERGDVAVIGESTTAEFNRGLGAQPSLKRLFVPFQLQPATVEHARDVLRDICDKASLPADDLVLQRLSDIVGFYDSATVEPGRSAGPLRRVVRARGADRSPIHESELLNSIAAASGMPVSILDDSVPLDRSAIRAFFEARVMGQTEAVSVLVDLVTMVKAGLTDPGRPFGVFLFVGPTGVGKTELARALAECLFGDRDRMVRIDVSVYAKHDAYERLIGQYGTAGTLTAPVREKPFSVVLLDEIEKGSVNVVDLCLQIFDAGRLTDSVGRTVDFRRTIIIMTSNLGAQFELQAQPGFGRETPGNPSDERILRDIRRAMRPEFLNRLDRIVVFQPLDAETAAKIAQREVSSVLARNGIARRHLAVDVDASVFALLLKEGYSQAYGARPLKRTVDRLVLLPVAEAIASGKAPAGSVLRLVASGARVRVDITAPAPEVERSPARPARSPQPHLLKHTEAWLEELASLRAQAAPLDERRGMLLARKTEPDFWSSPDSTMVLDEIYRLEGLLSGLDTFAQECRAAGREGRADRVAAVDARIRHLARLVASSDATALADAFVLLSAVSGERHDLDSVPQLARMLMAFAPRHGCTATVIDDRQGPQSHEDAITLSVGGVGAFALFRPEAGLHELARKEESTSRSRKGEDVVVRTLREVVRVDVLAAPVGASLPRDELKIDVRKTASTQTRLLTPVWDVRVVHRPTLLPIELRTDGTRQQAVQRAESIACALIRAKSRDGAPAQVETIRRYVTGASPRARDLRSGRTTTRVQAVFAGDIDLLRGAAAPE